MVVTITHFHLFFFRITEEDLRQDSEWLGMFKLYVANGSRYWNPRPDWLNRVAKAYEHFLYVLPF